MYIVGRCNIKSFVDIISFGVDKYFNGNFDMLESESLGFQQELHAKMIKYLMNLRDTSRPEDELDVSNREVPYLLNR